jgi:hypothetical protein
MANTKKTKPKTSSSTGCIFLIIGLIAWVALLIIGPFTFFDALDAKNTANTLAKGTVTLISQENFGSDTFNVLTITDASNSNPVKAIVQTPIYDVANAYCKNLNCYAEAEFESNDGLLKLSLYDSQGGAILARIANHSQEQDSLDWATVWSICFLIVTAILTIGYFIYTTNVKKNPNKNKAPQPQERVYWDGKSMPPQGGITSSGEWYKAPPSAVQLYSKITGNQTNTLKSGGQGSKVSKL